MVKVVKQQNVSFRILQLAPMGNDNVVLVPILVADSRGQNLLFTFYLDFNFNIVLTLQNRAHTHI